MTPENEGIAIVVEMNQRAWNTLVSVSKRFPDNSTVPYNLACYSARLGKLGEACHWLKEALRIDGSPELKLMALRDPDLKPVWENVDTIDVLMAEG